MLTNEDMSNGGPPPVAPSGATQQSNLAEANAISVAEIAAAKIAAAAADAADLAARQLELSTKAAIARITAATSAYGGGGSAVETHPPYTAPAIVASTDDVAASIVTKMNEALDSALVKAINAQPPLPPKTTLQEDITFASQRRINLIWEYTQAFIALSVVFANVVVGAIFGVYRIPSGEYPAVLSSSLFLVIGFYFSRTNHAAIGGIGVKPEAQYEGR